MIQRVCDGCEQPIPNGVEFVEIRTEASAFRLEDLHVECVNVGERVQRFFDEGAKRVEATRKTW